MMLFGMLTGALLSAGATWHDGPRKIFRRIIPAAGSAAIIMAILLEVEPWLIGRALKETAGDNLEGGQPLAAAAILERARFWTPRDPEVCTMLARAYDMTGNTASAEILLRRAILLRPQSASIRAQLAHALLKLGRTANAESEARNAIELYPSNADHHCLLARILETKGDLHGALAEARRAMELAYLNKQQYGEYARSLEQKLVKSASSTPP